MRPGSWFEDLEEKIANEVEFPSKIQRLVRLIDRLQHPVVGRSAWGFGLETAGRMRLASPDLNEIMFAGGDGKSTENGLDFREVICDISALARSQITMGGNQGGNGMDSVPIARLPMRFFVAACLFGLLIGSVGCVTNNWSVPIFKNDKSLHSPDTNRNLLKDLIGIPFSTKSGIDPRAREIEERLGY
jgi:hypothetical protein